MKLHELQIPHLRPGAPGHRHAIATGLAGVRGVGEEMAATATGQHHGASAQPAQPGAVDHLQADTAARFQPQLQRLHALALDKPRPPQYFPLQGVHQGSAGAILGMQDTAMAVGRLQGGAECLALAVEVHAQPQQLLHTGRGLADQQLHRLAIAEAGPSPQRVVDVALKAVITAGNRRDAALGPAAGGGRLAVLAEQQHPEIRRQRQAAHQAGGTAAHHHHIPAPWQRRLRRCRIRGCQDWC